MSRLEHRVGALEKRRASDTPAISTILVWQYGVEPPLDGEEAKGAEHMREFHMGDEVRGVVYLEMRDFREGRFQCHICE